MSLEGLPVMVTGANGFVGSRLVERLVAVGADVRALVRSGARSTRWTSDPRCRAFRGDVTDPESLHAATAGAAVVFHCAWGGSTMEESRLVNVEGTRHVLRAAATAGVRRVVHVSSMAVHGPLAALPPVLTEEHPLVFEGDAYSVGKAEGERLAFALGRELGLEVTAVRPTLVYGPRSPLWLVSYVERVRLEQIALVDGGRGIANLIHVDDLVDAMLALAEHPAVDGEAFLMSGPEPVTWREYIGAIAAMCGKPMPPSVSARRARLEVPFWKVYSTLTLRPRRVQTVDLGQMTQPSRVSIAKAARVFGYAPRLSVADGLRACEPWLRREGLLGRPVQERSAVPRPIAVGAPVEAPAPSRRATTG
jgi:nucleoside-diphosphate-sugar epimerase